MDLLPHPLADIFPLLEGAEFEALVADIRAHGQREPVVLLDGAILDGRNRDRACRAAGVEPRTITFDGDDPRAFVVSANLHRRHLTESQRGVVASKLANLGHGGDRRADQAANLPLEPPVPPPVSQARAAELLNVSERTVRAAGVVIDKGVPELVQAVERGQASVSAAAAVSRLPADVQAAVAGAPCDVVTVARAIRTHDPAPLSGLRDAIRPKVEQAVARLAEAERQRRASEARPLPVLPPVKALPPEWDGWIGAVDALATLPANLPRLAATMPDLHPKLLPAARAALPRLQSWIEALEAAHV